MKNALRLVIAAAIAIALAACSNPAGDDPGSVTPPIEVSGYITEDDTWSSDTYVSDTVNVLSGASLTIGRGVTITFASGASLVVEAGGSLIAIGTSAADGKIVFKNAASAAWGGIYLDDNAIANTMAYCEVTGVASGSYAITMDPGSIANIQNCVIHGNGGGGIDARDCALSTEIRFNRFYENTLYGLAASENSGIDHTNDFAAPGQMADLADPYNSVLFSGNVTMVDYIMSISEVPYRFDDDCYVTNDGSLEIWDGVRLRFAAGAGIVVEGGAILRAEGDLDHPVVFEGVNAAAAWSGIYIGDDSLQNVLWYCTISGVYGNYAVTIDPGADANIQHCTIADNHAGGIDAREAAVDTVISDNFFGNNGDETNQGPYDLMYDSGIFNHSDSHPVDGTTFTYYDVSDD